MQNEPPKLDHIAPKWFHERWERLLRWLEENRPLEGLNIQIVDGPGGGKVINALIPSQRDLSRRVMWTPRPITATSPLPADFARRLVIQPGTVAGTNYLDRLASNFDDEFVVPSNKTNWAFYISATLNGQGDILSFTINQDQDPPEQPDGGTSGSPPTLVYYTIFRISTDSVGIKWDSILQSAKGPVVMELYVNDITCTEMVRQVRVFASS